MPDCPDGTQIKPEIIEDQVWITVGDAIDEIADWLAPPRVQFLLGFLQSVAPSLEDLNEICSAPPEAPEVLDWDDIILRLTSGNSPQWMADWLFAAWRANRWSNYCECIEGVGSGTCPPVDMTSRAITAKYNDGYTTVASFTAPRGWTTFRFTALRVSDSNPVDLELRWEWRDAANAVEGPTFASNLLICTNAGTSTTSYLTMTSGGNTNDVRTVALVARPRAGTALQNGTLHTYTMSAVFDFTGTCTEVPVVWPPPPPPPPPGPPYGPWPVSVPTGCDLDDICGVLYKIQLELKFLVNTVITNNYHYAPSVTIPGTTIYNVEGSSSVEVSQLVGMKVEITSGVQPRTLEGTPPYQWDLGWMSVMTDDGMIEEKRITRLNEVWFPHLMPLGTTFGYYLKPGVTATFTQLIAPPA